MNIKKSVKVLVTICGILVVATIVAIPYFRHQNSTDNDADALYEAFLKGEIATTDGQFLDDYRSLAPENNPSYYYIQAKNASDKALVLSYAYGASVANDVIYAQDGELVVKGYFGRHAVSGSGLVDETYIVYESMMMDCNSEDWCEYYIIQKFTNNYDLVDEVYALNRSSTCTVKHQLTEYQDGKNVFKEFQEDLGYSDSLDYLEKKLGVDTTKNYYEPVEWAIELDD